MQLALDLEWRNDNQNDIHKIRVNCSLGYVYRSTRQILSVEIGRGRVSWPKAGDIDISAWMFSIC